MKKSVLLFLVFLFPAFEIVDVCSAQNLTVSMTTDSDVVQPDDRILFTFVATNSGSSDLLDLTAVIQLPDLIDQFAGQDELACGSNNTCSANEVISWNIGTLGAGESRTLIQRTFIAGNAAEGVIQGRISVSQPDQSDIFDEHSITIDPAPRMRLSIAADPGPATSGEAFGYTITLSNRTETSITDPVLRFTLPDGVTFVSASDGGVESEGIVNWELGPLGAGNGRNVRLDVLVNAEAGSLLIARAEADPQEVDKRAIGAFAVIPVGPASPLHIEYGVSQTSLAGDDRFVYTLTASNTGSEDLLDVTAVMLMPGAIDQFAGPDVFDCGSNNTCSANEMATWNIGTLRAGEIHHGDATVLCVGKPSHRMDHAVPPHRRLHRDRTSIYGPRHAHRPHTAHAHQHRRRPRAGCQ